MRTYQKRPHSGDNAPQSPVQAATETGNFNYQPTRADMGSRVDLPEVMRAKMENAFGMDFSGVQLYQSQAVADAGANAMTMGNKIAFAPGKLDFSSHSGQALLGHELSHVASQARGEVTGQGFLNDGLLEARADREGAMAAAGEQVYTGPVTPLSTSSAVSMSGPMQAKKEKNKSQGEQFEEAYREMSLSEQVKAMRDLSIGNIEDESLNRTYYNLAFELEENQNEAFVDELVRQQHAASNDLEAQYENLKKQGKNGNAEIDDDEAYIRTKYSPESIKATAYSDLLFTLESARHWTKDKKGRYVLDRKKNNAGRLGDYYREKTQGMDESNGGKFNGFSSRMSEEFTNRRLPRAGENGDIKYDESNLWGEQTDIGEANGLKDEQGRTLTNGKYLHQKYQDILVDYRKNYKLPQSMERKKWLAKKKKK